MIIYQKKSQTQKIFNKTKEFSYINKPILICVIFLSFFGVLMIYSASSYSADLNYGDSFFFARKQLVGVFIGLIFLFIIYKIDFNILQKYYKLALIVSLVLLALVFVPFLSVSNYGATRWIGFGSFTIQPSELAKFGLVLFCAG